MKKRKAFIAVTITKIVAAVKHQYPKAYVRQLNARTLPDIIIVFQRRFSVQHWVPGATAEGVGVLWVETKSKPARMGALQKAEQARISTLDISGHALIVARDKATVLERMQQMGAIS